MDKGLQWARSRRAGNISELTVMLPIRRGRIPGERRTYEERLRSVLGALTSSASSTRLAPLNQIPTLHFGRVAIIRPEHYLVHSDIPGIDYFDHPQDQYTVKDEAEQLGHEQSKEDQSEDVQPQRNTLASSQIQEQGAAFPARDSIQSADNPERQVEDEELARLQTLMERRSPSKREKVPKAIDPYQETFSPTVGIPDTGKRKVPEARSFLLTLVIFDGDPIVYLREIATFIEEQFDKIFENCENYPYVRNFEEFWRWVKRFQIQNDTFYTPYPNLSVARIKELELFKRRFDRFVSKVRSPNGYKVGSLDELFDEFLRASHQISSNFPSPSGRFDMELD